MCSSASTGTSARSLSSRVSSDAELVPEDQRQHPEPHMGLRPKAASGIRPKAMPILRREASHGAMGTSGNDGGKPLPFQGGDLP